MSNHIQPAAGAGLTTVLRAGAGQRTDAESSARLPADDLELLSGALHERLAWAIAGDGTPTDLVECLADLDQLQALMLVERGRSQRTIAALRAALAAASASERRARRRAYSDPLTRLPNRDVFFAKLADALVPSGAPQQIAVFYLDLDHFKAINDRHGHGAGDAVLRIVAARLTAAVRADDLVCRLGGDEFVCLLSGVADHASLSRIAVKLFDAVAAPLGVGALCLEVRPSIGIACWPEAGTTSAALIANADAAMYQAKRRRCGYAFFDEGSEGVFLGTVEQQQVPEVTEGSLPAVSAAANARFDVSPKLVLVSGPEPEPEPVGKVAGMTDHLLSARQGGGAHGAQGFMAPGDGRAGRGATTEDMPRRATPRFQVPAGPMPGKNRRAGGTVRLGAFIKGNLDVILEEWDAFAKTLLPAGRTISHDELRNPCRAILLAIANDMDREQSEVERSAKSRRMHKSQETDTAASTHGQVRQASGFNLLQVVGEFRAMRASVLELWSRAGAAELSKPAAEDIVRFNEAVDQALAESVERYAADAAESRELLLAVLGHDVRSPLSTIRYASDVLLRPTLPDGLRIEAARRVRRASDEIGRLTTDLFEYTRTQLGRGMPVELREADLRPVCEEAVDAVRSSHPEREVLQQLCGDLTTVCDAARMQQLLANLLNNAMQHSDNTGIVRLEAARTKDTVVLKVTNFGAPIPANAFEAIFEPLVQLPCSNAPPNGKTPHERMSTSLGLGLFIVREIVRGHQGTIGVESSAEAGTVFTVALPKPGAAV